MLLKFTFLFLPALLLANKAQFKVEEIDTNKDTTITIKKGVKAETSQCVQYEIIDGSEDISGAPEFDKAKARVLWKEACKEWRDNLKELNKGNSLINLNCGSSQLSKEEDKNIYKSKGTYKVKVKTRENAENQ